MTRSLTPFFSLFFSTAILLVGDGLFGTLLPLRALLEGFSTASLGLMGAAFFAGSMLGALFAPAWVRRVGHIRAFAAFASIASAVPLVHMLSSHLAVWILLRIATGFCLAGLYMIIESWLNEKATNENRGSIFAVYRAVCLVGLTLGQLTLNFAEPSAFTLFAIVAILTSFALVPVSLSRAVQPAPIESHKVSLRALWRISPVGMAGCFVVGLNNGPFWALAPVYAGSTGLDIEGISLFMTAAIVGGALAQVPVGRLSDRVDRRWVLIGALVGVIFAALYLAGAIGVAGKVGLYAGAFFFGASALSLYALCIAQANDHAASHQFVMVASGLGLVSSAGAVIGPLVVSLLIPFFGMGAIFGFSPIVCAPLILMVLARILIRAPVPADERDDFVAVPLTRSATTALELDPRSENSDAGKP